MAGCTWSYFFAFFSEIQESRTVSPVVYTESRRDKKQQPKKLCCHKLLGEKPTIRNGRRLHEDDDDYDVDGKIFASKYVLEIFHTGRVITEVSENRCCVLWRVFSLSGLFWPINDEIRDIELIGNGVKEEVEKIFALEKKPFL